MREIYTAANEEAGLAALDRFEKKWGGKYSYAIKSWSSHSRGQINIAIIFIDSDSKKILCILYFKSGG